MYSNEILLAEDDLNDAAFFRRALNKLDNPPKLSWKSSGTAALDELNERRVDLPLPKLAIFDIKMPGMNGLELLEAVRSNPMTKDLPVIVMSSSDDPEDIATAYNYGASSYLVKPGKFKDLQHLVESIDLFWVQTNRLRSLSI